jgi:nucleoid DNA-binding protein
MSLERYISELLYRYQCVTVPGFGSFLTQHQPAQVQEDTHVFYPPSKLVSFNAQLTSNDGLLAKHIADTEQQPYETILTNVEETVSTWKESLQNNQKLTLNNIGDLWLNEEGKMQFQPEEKVNYLTASFGLSSYTSQPVLREALKEEVVELEEKTPILFTPEKREEFAAQETRHPFLKYAAIFLLAISTGLTGYKALENRQFNTQKVAAQEAQQEVQRTIQEATFFDTAPLELPSITLPVNKQPEKYHVIAGAFRVEANALKKVQQLKTKGYNAKSVGVNKYGLHQIAYGSFANVNEALTYLRKIKTTVSTDAWLFVDNK